MKKKFCIFYLKNIVFFKYFKLMILNFKLQNGVLVEVKPTGCLDPSRGLVSEESRKQNP